MKKRHSSNSEDSSVDIVTCHRLSFDFLEGQYLSILHCVQIDFGANLTSYPTDTAGDLPEGKVKNKIGGVKLPLPHMPSK
jgi:hypothetical protein